MKKSSVKPFAVLWGVLIAAYAVWMAFFLKFDTYPAAETGVGTPTVYWIWTAFSVLYLCLFPLFLKRILFDGKESKLDQYFCLISLVFSFIFVTWYGFFKDPLEFTASMIGLDFPWHFKMWGLFASLAVFANTMYAYRKNEYQSPVGITLSSIGCAALFVTINVPSAGEDLILTSLRCMSHWTSALVFAFLGAGGILLVLLYKAKQKDKLYIALFASFAAILALMVILLVTVGKNGLIESLPMWAMYVVIYIVNFTKLGAEKAKPEIKQTAKV